jgi:hypothetical protein
LQHFRAFEEEEEVSANGKESKYEILLQIFIRYTTEG